MEKAKDGCTALNDQLGLGAALRPPMILLILPDPVGFWSLIGILRYAIRRFWER